MKKDGGHSPGTRGGEKGEVIAPLQFFAQHVRGEKAFYSWDRCKRSSNVRVS